MVKILSLKWNWQFPIEQLNIFVNLPLFEDTEFMRSKLKCYILTNCKDLIQNGHASYFDLRNNQLSL